jgi:hypothetical protein
VSWDTPVIPETVESIKQEDCSPDLPGQKQDPISKITRVKRAGGVVQVVEYLPSKHKALNSYPSNTKKKKKFLCTMNHGSFILVPIILLPCPAVRKFSIPCHLFYYSYNLPHSLTTTIARRMRGNKGLPVKPVLVSNKNHSLSDMPIMLVI